ncbi:GTPase LSG1-2 isoform X2 [Lycium ferocissimum]|uniref:GTPase LSG1-2 isoform X2 n=1 Tax=Lycium ferocissimum TaxID=112874 RepID=UPI002814B688|nr:GTPase LSG1-2 isoform X2 [Lycium ferocissimum]
MRKGEKTSLGRALVKHHNQMIPQSKERGRFFRNNNKKVLESVTEVTDVEAVIEQTDEAHRLYSDLNPPVNLLVNLDSGSSTSDLTPEERKKQQKKEEALHASSLRVPRRPPWNTRMSVEELDANERQSFLAWRRNLARLEENEKLVLTPFEKNLDIWRQLWRVVERSDLLVMVVDARDPLFYRCPDLEAYALEVDQHKKTMLLVNKADLLPISIRKKWAEYFHKQGILFLFWSAKAASAALSSSQVPTSSQEAGDADTKILGREELLARLQSAAEEIVLTRNRSASHADENLAADVQSRSVMVGFVGYPNVGKSSTINALVGEKRAGVTSTPGKTKHFQTLVISPKLTLCDCPGLVFPSFTSSRYEMIACGVLPIDRITEHREAVQVVANRVPRKIIEEVYNISLPKPKPYEPQSRPPTAAELLRSYCASRGYVASSGLPDETRATRQMLKDYVDGKLPHFELPPGELDDEASEEDDEDVTEDADGPRMSGSDYSDDNGDEEDDEDENARLDHVLSDLSTFDMANGLASDKEARKKKPTTAHHKQHKKTQRKKDRSWRVQNGEGDGMPVVRVFRKAANTGPVNVR